MKGNAHNHINLHCISNLDTFLILDLAVIPMIVAFSDISNAFHIDLYQ